MKCRICEKRPVTRKAYLLLTKLGVLAAQIEICDDADCDREAEARLASRIEFRRLGNSERRGYES